ncbi:MAG: PepSY domain-containing protein [Candidatus Thiodiazotropha sp.]
MFVLFLCGGAGADDGQMQARRLVSEGRILPLEQILAGIRQFRPGQILEVEFDEKHHQMIYEIEMLDVKGTVWELKVDAVTGEIIEQELED